MKIKINEHVKHDRKIISKMFRRVSIRTDREQLTAKLAVSPEHVPGRVCFAEAIF